MIATEEAAKQKQIEFFDAHGVEEYEKNVVNLKYYKALDEIVFSRWTTSLKGKKILDLGCGTGRQAIPLAKAGFDVTAVDISPDMIDLARRKAGSQPGITWIVGDAENPPGDDGTFDACIIYGTLHHLHDKEATLQNALKKLKPGGVFLSLDPHKSPVRFIFDWIMTWWKLYDEEADEDPLLTREDFQTWLPGSEVKLSTYFPPHLCNLFPQRLNVALIRVTDWIFNRTPLAGWGGVIIARYVKPASAT